MRNSLFGKPRRLANVSYTELSLGLDHVCYTHMVCKYSPRASCCKGCFFHNTHFPREAKPTAVMSRTTSVLVQTSQLLLPFVCLALGASMLGISSDILAFTHDHRDDRVDVRDNTGFYPYLIHLPYLPRNFSLTRPILLLVTGLLCALLNAAVFVLLIWSRKVKTDGNGRKVRPQISHFTTHLACRVPSNYS